MAVKRRTQQELFVVVLNSAHLVARQQLSAVWELLTAAEHLFLGTRPGRALAWDNECSAAMTLRPSLDECLAMRGSPREGVVKDLRSSNRSNAGAQISALGSARGPAW